MHTCFRVKHACVSWVLSACSPAVSIPGVITGRTRASAQVWVDLPSGQGPLGKAAWGAGLSSAFNNTGLPRLAGQGPTQHAHASLLAVFHPPEHAGIQVTPKNLDTLLPPSSTSELPWQSGRAGQRPS